LPGKDSAAGSGDFPCFAEAVGLADFPSFAEAAGLVDPLYFAKVVEHLHLELDGY
jgi:hypothetical protein